MFVANPPGIKSEDFSNLSVDVAPRPATSVAHEGQDFRTFRQALLVFGCWVVCRLAPWVDNFVFGRIVLAAVDMRQILGPLLKEKEELAPFFKKLAPF